MGDMSDIERVWREKTDDELIEAAGELADYTSEGRQVIRAELKRRGLEDPVEQAGGDEPGTSEEQDGEAEPIPGPQCVRCHVELQFLGTKSFHEGTHWGVLGEIGHLFEKSESFDVYVCPRCGHVDLFVSGVGRELRSE